MIPGIGYTDDAMAVAFCIKMMTAIHEGEKTGKSHDDAVMEAFLAGV